MDQHFPNSEPAVISKSADLDDAGLLSRSVALRVQREPIPSLVHNESQLSPAVGRDSGLQISKERFGLPVLGLPTDSSAMNTAVVILANTAGQLINSPVYFDPSDEAQRFRQEHEESTLSQVLGFSKPGDWFVASSVDPERMQSILHAIRNSYKRAGLELSSDFMFIRDPSEIAESACAGMPILPAILTPEAFDVSTATDAERLSARGIAIANIAAYTKDGAEKWWNLNGIPTPHTQYIHLGLVNHQSAVDALQSQFSDYDELVINTTGGSGGYALHRLNLANLTAETLRKLFGDEVIQAQGLLDVAVSPCVIASIDDDSSKVLGVSIQKFEHGFGIHSGNYWNRDLWVRFELDYPGITKITTAALDCLRKAGVRGQVNIDLMCVSEQERLDRGLTARSVLREANIRPAGSSVFLRLQEGQIDGERVEHIASATGISIDVSERGLASVLSILDEYRSPGRTRAVLYSVNPLAESCSIAFLGARGCSLEDLVAFEKRLINTLSER